MIRLSRVAVDGVKLPAAASKHKAMSYDLLVSREEQLDAEIADLETRIAAMLTEAETVDAAEDARQVAGTGGRAHLIARLDASRAQLQGPARRQAPGGTR